MEDLPDQSEQPAQGSQAGNRHAYAHWMAIGAIVLYVVLHAILWYCLDQRTIVSDEYYHRRAAFNAYAALTSPELNVGQRLWRMLSAGGSYPPVTYVLGTASCWLFGQDLKSLRLGSGFLLAIPLLCVFAILRRLGCGAGLALFGAFFLAVTPGTVISYRVFQNEAPLTAVVALMYYLLVTDPDLANRRRAILVGCVMGLGMLTKWAYPIYVTIPLGYCFARIWWPGRNWGLRKEAPQLVWRARANSLLAITIGVLLALPYYLTPHPWVMVSAIESQQMTGMTRVAGLVTWALNLWDLLTQMADPMSGGPLFLLFVGLGLIVLAVRPTKRGLVVLAAVLGTTVCLTSIRQDTRWFSPVFPAMAAAAVYGLSQLRWKRTRWSLTALASLWIVMNLSGSWELDLLPDWAYPYTTHVFPREVFSPQTASDRPWQMKEITDAIVRDLGDKKEATGFMPYHISDGFHVRAVEQYALDRGVTLTLACWSPESDLDFLFNTQYLIVKSNGQWGMDDLKRTAVFQRILLELSESFYTAHYKKIGEFPLKDYSTATLYRQDNPPIALQEQIAVIEALMEKDPELAEDPSLLVQLGSRLVKAGQPERLKNLTSKIPDAVMRALDAPDTPPSLHAFLLLNSAFAMVLQDEAKRSQFTQYLENRVFPEKPGRRRMDLNQLLGEGRVLASFYQQVGRLDAARRVAESLVQRYPNRWEPRFVQSTLCTTESESETLLQQALATTEPPNRWAVSLFFPQGDLWEFCMALGSLAAGQRDSDKAEAFYLKAAEVCPTLAEPCFQLALRIYYPQDQYDKARQFLEEGRRREWDHPSLAIVQETLQAAEFVTWALELGEDSTARQALAARAGTLDNPFSAVMEARLQMEICKQNALPTSASRIAQIVSVVLPHALRHPDPFRAIEQAALIMEMSKQLGSSAAAQRLAETVTRTFAEAAKKGDPSKAVNLGASLVELYEENGFTSETQRLADILLRQFPERNQFWWLGKSVDCVVAHQYDWLSDPIEIRGCELTVRNSAWVKADVSRHAYIYPRGHGRPFPCDGSYALQFDLKIVTQAPTFGRQLLVYLNTHSGLGRNGSDWGEFDSTYVPVETSGTVKSYTIPLWSKVANAKFVYELRFDPLDGATSYTFELRDLRLLRLKSAATSPEPKPQGFVEFTVGKQNLVSISSRKPLSSSSPLILDHSPLQGVDAIRLTSGTHVLQFPKGWSQDDVTVRAVGREFSVQEFQNPLKGAVLRSMTAYLLGQDSSVDIPTSLTAKKQYSVAVEAANSVPPPVILALRSGDNPTTLAKFVFAKGDRSVVWQEQTVTTTATIPLLRLAFTNDYVGPEGDRNALIRRVRVVEK